MKKREGLKFPEIKKAAKILKKGGIVIFPTDTVYGIGCRFDDVKAIQRIYKIKRTPKNQPFPILVSNIDRVKKLATINEVARDLIYKYWPGGLTIILAAKKDSQKIGFRMPNSDLVFSLIGEVGMPIIGTSANFHDNRAVARFTDLHPELVKLADYTIKGKCQGKVESTVVDATVDPPKILRKGAVSIDNLPARSGLRPSVLSSGSKDSGSKTARQVLSIDTTKAGEVTVEIIDKQSGKKDSLVQKQKLGSQVLLPLIVKILKKNKSGFDDLTAVEVNVGPGSFTGTRVGVAVANALGFALGIPVNGRKGKIAKPIYEKSKFDI